MKKTILIRITAALLGLLSAIGLCACSKPGISVGTGDPSGSVSGEQSPSLLPSDPSAVLPSLPSDGNGRQFLQGAGEPLSLQGAHSFRGAHPYPHSFRGAYAHPYSLRRSR